MPTAINVISLSECEVTYDTTDGVKICKYRASKIVPGELVIFDCSDPEYWHFTSASDELREFDRTTIGGIFFSNSFESITNRPKFAAISVIDGFEDVPVFEILFENPKVSVVCQLDENNNLLLKSKQALPEFFSNFEEKAKLVKMLCAFEIAYWVKLEAAE